ncbi:MAG TPA: S-adenosylmethionine decarboxylase proenzyme, partial [Synergistaceae bacterium]|nr:S-adenosylmethionine decarboxylase proenzyme [Synergistaceae bacterium]
LSIHTWPEAGYMALDIYTCGAESLPEKAVDYVLQKVNARHTHVSEITRGLEDNGDREFYHSLITWEEELRKED